MPNDRNLRVLSAEGAAIGGVLGHFHLLNDLTKGGTVSGSVLTANSDLLSVVSLKSKLETSRACQRNAFGVIRKTPAEHMSTHITQRLHLTILIS